MNHKIAHFKKLAVLKPVKLELNITITYKYYVH